MNTNRQHIKDPHNIRASEVENKRIEKICNINDSQKANLADALIKAIVNLEDNELDRLMAEEGSLRASQDTPK